MTEEIIEFADIEKNKKLYSTKELAKQFNVSVETIRANTKKFLPNKKLVKGKNTYYTDIETTAILEGIKSSENTARATSRDTLEVIKETRTELTTAYKIAKTSKELEELYKQALKEEQEAHEKTKNMYEQTKKELTYQTLSKEKYQDLVWIEAERGKELEGYLDKRTDKQKQRAKYVYMQD